MTQSAPLVGSNIAAGTFATASATRFMAAFGPFVSTDATNLATTEAQVQLKIGGAATWADLAVQVLANTRTTTTTIKSRINAADGAQVISVSASTTGVLQDVTHSDTLASGDLIDLSMTTGSGTGNFTIQGCGSVLTTTGQCFTHWGGASTALITRSTASTTAFYYPFGGVSAETETLVNAALPDAVTLSGLRAYVASNARTTTTTIRVRNNGANGNQVLSIGSGVTGAVEDTTHTDSITATNPFCLSLTTSTGSQTMVIASMSLKVVGATTNRSYIGVGEISNDSGVTDFILPWGVDAYATISTESQTQCATPLAGTLSNMTARMASPNSSTATITVRLRKNAVNGNQVVTFTSGTTGNAQDLTHSDVVAVGDLLGCTTSGSNSASSFLASIGFAFDVSSGVTTNKSCLATTTPAKTLVRRTGKAAARTVSTAKTLKRAMGLTRKVTASTAKTAVRQTGKALKRTVSTAKSITTPRTRPKTATVTAATTKTLVRSVGKIASRTVATAKTITRAVGLVRRASTTPAKSLRRAVGKAAQATTTPAKTLTRRLNRAISRTVSAATTLTRSRARTLQITVGTAKTLRRTVGKIASRTVTSAKTLKRAIGKGLSKAVTLAGTQSHQRVKLISALAATTPVRTLKRQTGKLSRRTVGAAAGLKRGLSLVRRVNTTPAATARRQTGKALRKSTTPAAVLSKLRVRLVSALAATTPARTLARTTSKAIRRAVSAAAATRHAMSLSRRASTTPVARAVRRTGKSGRVTTTPVGSMVRIKAFGKVIAATVSAVASRRSRTGKSASAATSVAATVKRRLARSLAVTVGAAATAAVLRFVQRAFSVSTSPAVTGQHTAQKTAQASTRPVARAVKQTAKTLSAAVGVLARLVKVLHEHITIRFGIKIAGSDTSETVTGAESGETVTGAQDEPVISGKANRRTLAGRKSKGTI